MSNTLVPAKCGTEVTGTQTSGTQTPVAKKRRSQRGMTTAEYAVGTVASVSVVAAIIAVIRTPEFNQLFLTLIKLIFNGLPGLFGM